MRVYEFHVKLLLKSEIRREDQQRLLTDFWNRLLSSSSELLEMHLGRDYKPYCFGNLFPVEKDGCYHQDHVYGIRIRTIDDACADLISSQTRFFETDYLLAVSCEPKIIREHAIGKVFSLTPVLIKNDDGYWEDGIGWENYLKRLEDNLYKKYRHFYGESLDEKKLFKSVQRINKYPLAFRYKGIQLLGDRLKIHPNMDEDTQKVIFLALGVGLGEGASIGCGFLEYEYLK